MAFQEVSGYAIKGISAAVPSNLVENKDMTLLGSQVEIQKFIESTHIRQRYIVGSTGLTTSDLCFHAAAKLFQELGWHPSEVEILIFVTQTPDYQLPSTAIILQNRLGLSIDSIAIQISLGCSGWVFGLSTLLSLLKSVNGKKGILLVGDTVSMTKSPYDKSTYPLFGDAGTATAIEYDQDAAGFKFHLGNDGAGYRAIIIEDGGYRNPVSPLSLNVSKKADGVIRNNLQSQLNGQEVFIFGITKAPRSIMALMERYSISLDSIDYLILHQANKMMNDKIARKVGFPEEKVPYSLHIFGNTSSASIPITMVSQIKILKSDIKKHIACGFGVGLSWGSVFFETNNIVCPDILYINN